MIYTANNCEGRTKVFEVETKRELKQVMSIDTDAGLVYMAHQPIRINASGDSVDMFAEKYRSIYAIFGGCTRPCLFHCYGRLA